MILLIVGFIYRCNLKCMQDISEDVRQSIIHFVNNFDSKNAQDTYLQTLIEKREIQRKRPRSEGPKKREFTYIYHIKIKGVKNKVCKKAFCGIHGISEKQVRRLCDLLKTNKQPIDHRGKSEGSRTNAVAGDTLTKIREHIESFPVKCVHYYNKDTSSYYLDEKLNLKIMHTIYQQKYPDYPVKYKFYLKYFQENFSLSFGRKQIDVCALCEELKLKLKNPHLNDDAKRVYKADLEMHKSHANKFYKKLQEVESKCKNDPKVYGIAFDYMQNLPLPHIPVQDVFYLRQLWLYEFCIYDLKTGKSVFYSYCEGVANKGPNEVGTFVVDYIKKNIGHDAEELHLFSDGCAGQNRNHAMVRLLLSLVGEQNSNITEIQYYIPKRGHSFLPNDRMFGTAKRHIRKNDRIYTPAEYENLIVEANENFEIRRPKTEEIIDIKKWWPNHYKKLVLSVDSYGKRVPKDKKKTFAISQVSHFTFSKSTPGLVTTRESIDCLTSYEFQLLQRMGTSPPLPSNDTPAYAGKVPINEKKIPDLKKLEKYIPEKYQNFYAEIFAWPTTSANEQYEENNDD